MKKIICSLSILILVFSSCSKSSSDEASIPVSSKLIQYISTEGGETRTSNLTYNGDKLVSIENVSTGTASNTTTYTYTGDLITASVFTESPTSIYNRSYTYDSSNRLIIARCVRNNTNSIKEVFTYNADVTISYTEYTGTPTNEEQYTDILGKFHLTNNQVDRFDQYPVPGQTTFTKYTTFNFDTKNNPLQGITGYNGIILAEGKFFEGILNNLTTEVENKNFIVRTVNSNTYTYNANNYPLTQVNVYTSSSGETTTTNNQFIYQ